MKNSNFNSNFFYNGHQIWYNSLSNEFLVLNNFLNELFVASLNENNVDDLINGNHNNGQATRKRFIKNNGYYKLPLFFRSHIYFIYLPGLPRLLCVRR